MSRYLDLSRLVLIALNLNRDPCLYKIVKLFLTKILLKGNDKDSVNSSVELEVIHVSSEG